jgi:hypothetical protein
MPSDEARARHDRLQRQVAAIVTIERDYVDNTIARWLPDHVYRLDGVVRSIDKNHQVLDVDFGGGDFAPVDWGTDVLPAELGLGSAIRVLLDVGDEGTAPIFWFDGLRH